MMRKKYFHKWEQERRKKNARIGLWLLGVSCLAILTGICIKSEWSGKAQVRRQARAEEKGQTVQTAMPSEEAVVTPAPTKNPEKEINYYKKLYKKKKATTVVSVADAGRQQIKALFYPSKISGAVFKRMYKKSYKKNCTVPKSELRYIRVLYYGFDKKTHIGELVVNRRIADDVCTIFYKLYRKKYPIEKMVLVDEYNAVDEDSMADNNTSAFNYRPVSGTTRLSKHSYGMAIDINPLYNPYIHTINGKRVCEPANGKKYMNRSKVFPYKITKKDLCYKLFARYGFTWGGNWKYSKDYQHFEKELS